MESSLKPCPFCGAKAKFVELHSAPDEEPIGYICCVYRCCEQGHVQVKSNAVKDWNRRASEVVKVEIPFYDKEEIHENCTVQVLTNTATGDVSVGWWKNETD